jgi:hypothetical protein
MIDALHMLGNAPYLPSALYEPAGDEEADEIDGRLRRGSHWMAFEGKRKAVIRSFNAISGSAGSLPAVRSVRNVGVCLSDATQRSAFPTPPSPPARLNDF